MRDSLGDYPPEASRPAEDQIAARELMATDGLHEEWYYAAQLFDETNFDAWEKLLNMPDPYIHELARYRMARMQSSEIRELYEALENLYEFNAEAIENPEFQEQWQAVIGV